MGEARRCDYCGTGFVPRREHARFCSARCRVAWNRGKLSYPPAESSALAWSVTAMNEATERLTRVRTGDRQRGYALIGEAVWWVTIVDATLVRHHTNEYDEVRAGYPAEERDRIDETLSGLRSVRNRVGQDVDLPDLVAPPAGSAPERITRWTWRSVPEPRPASPQPRGQEWELARYRSYQSHLAGRLVGEVFGLAAEFLRRVAAAAAADEQADPTAPESPGLRASGRR